MSVNRVILLGFVGQDPMVKVFESNTKGANFSLATSKIYISNNEKVTKTEWHNVSAYGNLADVVEKYIHKGSRLYIEGELQTRKWTDSNNIDRYITEVIANSIVFLDNKENEGEKHG